MAGGGGGGVGRTWLSWDGLSVSQRISYPPANFGSSSKSGFRTAKRGRPEAQSIPGVLVVSLFMFSWPNQVTWQPRCKSWETDHFLTRESILSPWKSLGLGKGVICNWFFFFSIYHRLFTNVSSSYFYNFLWMLI